MCKPLLTISKDLQTLLDASEKIRSNQEKIISTQQAQIQTLELLNKNLEAELNQVRSYAIQLTEDYNEVVAMCKEQQEILNSLADI